MPFDPYYQWLGIPPEEQPADHYRLLSVPRFTPDLDVIENAVDRQMAHVRTFQGGKHSEASQRLLNELAAVRVCLLNADQKAAYDAQLTEALTAEKPPVLPVVAPATNKTTAATELQRDVIPPSHEAVERDSEVEATDSRRTVPRFSRTLMAVPLGTISVIALLMIWKFGLSWGATDLRDAKSVAVSGPATVPQETPVPPRSDELKSEVAGRGLEADSIKQMQAEAGGKQASDRRAHQAGTPIESRAVITPTDSPSEGRRTISPEELTPNVPPSTDQVARDRSASEAEKQIPDPTQSQDLKVAIDRNVTKSLLQSVVLDFVETPLLKTYVDVPTGVEPESLVLQIVNIENGVGEIAYPVAVTVGKSRVILEGSDDLDVSVTLQLAKQSTGVVTTRVRCKKKLISLNVVSDSVVKTTEAIRETQGRMRSMQSEYAALTQQIASARAQLDSTDDAVAGAASIRLITLEPKVSLYLRRYRSLQKSKLPRLQRTLAALQLRHKTLQQIADDRPVIHFRVFGKQQGREVELSPSSDANGLVAAPAARDVTRDSTAHRARTGPPDSPPSGYEVPPEPRGLATKNTHPVLTIALKDLSVNALEKRAARSATARQAVQLYEQWMHQHEIGDEYKQTVKERYDTWQARSDEKLVRLGTKWVTTEDREAASRNAEKLLVSASQEMRKNNSSRALQLLGHASKANRNGIAADYLAGLYYTVCGLNNPENAERYFKQVLVRSPGHSGALNNLALTAAKLEDFGQAYELWARAIQIAPHSPRITHNVRRLTQKAKASKMRVGRSLLTKYQGLVSMFDSHAGEQLRFKKGAGWMYSPLAVPDDSPAAQIMEHLSSFGRDRFEQWLRSDQVALLVQISTLSWDVAQDKNVRDFEDITCVACIGTSFIRCRSLNCRERAKSLKRTVPAVSFGRTGIFNQLQTRPARRACEVCRGTGFLRCQQCIGGIEQPDVSQLLEDQGN